MFGAMTFKGTWKSMFKSERNCPSGLMSVWPKPAMSKHHKQVTETLIFDIIRIILCLCYYA